MRERALVVIREGLFILRDLKLLNQIDVKFILDEIAVRIAKPKPITKPTEPITFRTTFKEVKE